MKKTVSLLLIVAMVLSGFAIAIAETTDEELSYAFETSAIGGSAYETIENISIDFNKDFSNVFSSTQDEEGNALGPHAYAISDNGAYILNTANNTIWYKEDSCLGKISLDDFGIVGLDISLKDGKIIVLNNDLSIYSINKNQAELIGTAQKEMTIDNAVGFKVFSDYLYVSEPTAQGGQTHQYIIDPDTGKLQFNRTITGYMVDESTFYQSKLLPAKGQSVGHECKVNILNADGAVIDEIVLKSDHYIAGVQYLGKNSEGLFIVKEYDMACADDGSFNIEETIRTADKNNQVRNCAIVENSIPSMDDQLDIQNGRIVYFGVNDNDMCISEVKTENLPDVKEYSSRLPILSASSTFHQNEQTISTRDYISVTRTAVMNDAQAYHSNFTWTCYSRNLAALTNWTKPRYIGSAGTYSYMPYCWGGFSTVNQFKAAMNSTGRVGNINTSTSGHVSNTYGLDCSGYISRVWFQPQKYGTSTISQISYSISASNLLRGDALNHSGSHIVLFHYNDGSGRYILYEATKLNSYDRVSHTARNISSLSSYSAIRYYGITGA